jgi:MerR family transcriptional regulator/heat shock protein HspR
MSVHPLIPRDTVAQHLGVSTALLVRYELRGLVHASSEDGVEGYEPSQLRRLWSVVTLHREAGINLAGVECILHMRDQLEALQMQMRGVATELRKILEADLEPDDADL